MTHRLKILKRVVVKVGTSILTDSSGQFSKEHAEKLCAQVLEALKMGREIVLVSSGAIASGMDVLGMKTRPKELPKLQACAAVGQGKLMRVYEEFFAKKGFHAAQVLLTRDGVEDRERYLNARNTLQTLLKMKILPIVNENDTVATEEIRFGDNDTLSALVGSLVEADLLLILSDVEGFYRKDKTLVRKVETVREIHHELRKHLFQNKREKTIGGMETKLEAARFLMQAGISMVVANGSDEHILAKILRGEDVGTWFSGGRTRRTQKKNWLAFSKTAGDIHVDAGARKALAEGGKSLLPSGIVKISGTFGVGAVVRVLDTDGALIARGLTNYSFEELGKIKGLKTQEISKILGYKYYDEVIHRDNLVIV